MNKEVFNRTNENITEMDLEKEKHQYNENKLTTKNENKVFKQIVNTLYNEELEGISKQEETIENVGSIKIEPKIIYDRFLKEMKMEFKIGNKRMYKIKDLSEFYTRMLNRSFYKYGDKLEFIHTKEVFERDSQELLQFLLKYAEIIKYANSNSNSNYRYYGKTFSTSTIVLSNSGIDEIFNILQGKKVEFQKDSLKQNIEFTQEQPKIEFYLEKENENKYVITPNKEVFKVSIIQGRENKYILDDKKLYKCTKEFERTNLKMLEIFRQNYMSEIVVEKEQIPQLFSVVIPVVKNAITIKGMTQEEIEEYEPKKLVAKVFLDFEENNYMIADIKFCYEDKEFNPLDEKQKNDFPRDMIKETRLLNIFRKTGFMIDINNLRFILTSNEKIYQFLTEDINIYMQHFEVLVTDKFKSKQIKQPKLGTLGVKVENDLLSIDLSNFEIDIHELEEIMKKYNMKKKYHRLKDGSFLKLEDNKEIDFLDKLITGMNIKYENLEDGQIILPIQRSVYLNKLLKGIKGTEVIKNVEYKQLVNCLDKENLEDDIKVPDELEKILRYYQKTGFKWLKGLEKYKFGGILADDMGLGKTIQILSIIVDYVENDKNRKASLVVCPSSLSLNWQNEAHRFTKQLRTLVIRGDSYERERLISQIDKYDLIITSYDLLKRDIELYRKKDYSFKYIIADEAQYLKNSNTKNAKTIKGLKSDTRYALTGTPIENSLSELWSIFDFIMPGYLFSYKEFKALYEIPIMRDDNQSAMTKLKMLIEPFILRRNKKEVLTELPDKTITVLNNEMTEEQKNIYLSYLLQAKQEVAEQIDINGFERSHIQILAALTRLRQICCHPSLFIDEYKGGSSKLEQCIEIIEEAIKSGHKILLFSGYTSMFEIIQKQLERRKIKYFKLTGATKVDDRIELVDKFNESKDVKVFLISLKAGGTGLNLTGADMVIHYDPWWNISTENQATDRAYRIGQKNNVQVYKLITKDSIEEKIHELQQKKEELVENMLDTNTSFVNKLTKEDIMKLFE